MLRALYNNKREITLKQLIEIEGADPKKWTGVLTCPSCHALVHTYGVKRVLQEMAEGKKVVTQPAKARPVWGFHHMDKAASEKCRQSFSNDPRFQGRRKQSLLAVTNEQIESLVSSVLESDDVLEKNLHVTQKLWQALCRQELDKKNMLGLQKKLYRMEGLAHFAWLAPYFLVLASGVKEVKSLQRPYHYKVRFLQDGKKNTFYFSSMDLQTKAIIVSEKIRLFFVHGSLAAGNLRYHPFNYGTTSFDVTKEAYEGLAGTLKAREMKREAPRGVQMTLFR